MYLTETMCYIYESPADSREQIEFRKLRYSYETWMQEMRNMW